MIPAPRPNRCPCSHTCTHMDCISARLTATARCLLCDQPIGYDRPFTRQSTDRTNPSWHIVHHHNCQTPGNPQQLPVRPLGRQT